jgi:hypothetical protein
MTMLDQLSNYYRNSNIRVISSFKFLTSNDDKNNLPMLESWNYLILVLRE